jgi:hypothetical protein
MKMRKLLFAVAATTCIASAAIGAASAQAQPMPDFSLYATVNGSSQHEIESMNYSCESDGWVNFTGTGSISTYTETIEGELNKKTGEFSFSSEYTPGGYSWSAEGTAHDDMMSDDMNFTATSFTGAGVVSVSGTFSDVPPCSHGQYVSGARAAGVSGMEFKEIVKNKDLIGPYPS